MEIGDEYRVNDLVLNSLEYRFPGFSDRAAHYSKEKAYVGHGRMNVEVKEEDRHICDGVRNNFKKKLG